MKQFIASIFLMVFSLQALPVKEIGKLLCKGFLTEEEAQATNQADEIPGSKLKKEIDPFSFCRNNDQNHSRIEFLTHQIHIAFHTSENLPTCFVPDILTPPPNFLS